MEKMVTVLLMLVMLGVFIHSSQASLKCYKCTGCDEPTEETCHNGDVCLKVRSEVAGHSSTSRACDFKSNYAHEGCKSTRYQNVQSADVCVCDTELCNGAVMTSSFGHVITAVVVLLGVIFGQLM